MIPPLPISPPPPARTRADEPACPIAQRLSTLSKFKLILNGYLQALHRNSLAVYTLVLMLLFTLLLVAPRAFIVIPAGHVGVMWRQFHDGTVTNRSFGEGLNIIFPWNELIPYDTRLQQNTRVYDTISSNGLAMQVEIAVRYRLNADCAGYMHKLVGENYQEVLISTSVGSHARELISKYTPEQLYTETRAFIQAEIFDRIVTQFGSSLADQGVCGKMVNVEDLLIRSIQLPESVASAVERKAQQHQAMLEYDFLIIREGKEAERKRIEAEGLRDYQRIVANTITNEYLRLRGIEATAALATSTNAKTVIIGGRDGLPVILNTGDTPSQSSSVKASEARTSANESAPSTKGPPLTLAATPPTGSTASAPAAPTSPRRLDQALPPLKQRDQALVARKSQPDLKPETPAVPLKD